MNSLILANYFEKQAKGSRRLQELMAQAAHCLLLKEEQRSSENSLFQEALTYTRDVYELEGIAEQLKLQYQQQCTEQECMRSMYKHSVEFFVEVRNFNWDAHLQCKLELLQMRCQNEMLEMNEEYEAEQKRRRELEQRKSVQWARIAESEVANIQAKLADAKNRVAASEATLLRQLKELHQEHIALIVALVTGSKQIADREKELENMKAAKKNHIKELTTQKQELVAKLEKHNTKLPGTTSNDVELSQGLALPKTDNVESTTKLEAFSNQESASNAIINVERKELSFMDLFKEWEAKRQLQFQQLLATNTKAFAERSQIITNAALSSLGADHLKSTNNGAAKTIPRSILRRPSTEDDDNGTIVPKKRVRFATPEAEGPEQAFVSALDVENDERREGEERKTEGNGAFVIKESNFYYNGNMNEGQTWDRKSRKDIDDTFVFEDTNILYKGNLDDKIVDEADQDEQNDAIMVEESNCFVNGDTETIEILSTDEVAEDEQPTMEEVKRPQPKKTEFLTANKLLKKAKLLSTQKLNKTAQTQTAASDKPKIEIQECRIIKPAGTKLPTKLPIELTPELIPPARLTKQPKAADATQVKSDKIFKVPSEPAKRKARKMPDCDEFFREFLQQSNEENARKTATADKTVHGTKATSIASNADNEQPKSKLKKTEMDFDSFYDEALMCSNESSVDSAAEMQAPLPKNGKGNFLQFDMNFDDENQGLLGESLNEFFGGQVGNNDKDDLDDDSLTFDFGGATNSEMGKLDILL